MQYRQMPTDVNHQKVRNHGGTLKSKLDVVKGAVYTVPPAALNDLAADPDIVYVSPDRQVKGLLEFAQPTINANLAFQSAFDGTGVGVVVIDSGITNGGTNSANDSRRPMESRHGWYIARGLCSRTPPG